MERLRPIRLLILQVAALTVAAAAALASIRGLGLQLADPRITGLWLLAASFMYGTLAAMAAYMAWAQFSTIEVTAAKEANLLGEIYDLSAGLSDREEAQRLAGGLRRYLEMVLIDEWRGLADSRADGATHELFLDVTGRLRALRAKDPHDERTIEDIHERIGPWAHFRKKRVSWGMTRIPRPLWWLLCLLAWVVVLTMVLYPANDLRSQVVCVGLAAAVVSWAQLAIRDIDNPFEGYCSVSPAAFDDLAQRLNLKHQPRREPALQN